MNSMNNKLLSNGSGLEMANGQHLTTTDVDSNRLENEQIPKDKVNIYHNIDTEFNDLHYNNLPRSFKSAGMERNDSYL